MTTNKKKPTNLNSSEFLFKPSSEKFKSSRKVKNEREVSDVRNELFKSFNRDEVIDSFEKTQGIRGARKAKEKTQYHNILLDLSDEKDQKRLDKVLNDGKFFIIYYDKFWTIDGVFKMFMVFGERIEEKSTVSVPEIPETPDTTDMVSPHTDPEEEDEL